MEDGMIIIKIGDGMGNQMFNYACGYALARRDGEQLKLDTSECDNSNLRDYELDFFNIKYDAKESYPNRTVWQKIYKRIRRDLKYHVYKEKDWFTVDMRIYKKTLRNRYLHGYWQNVAYFKEYLNELCEMFTPKRELRMEVRTLIDRFSMEETCAVHVRGGDINGPVPEYFRKAMQMMKKKEEKIQFIIFTNDKQKAAECIGVGDEEEHISYIGNYGEFSDKEEFLLMSACKNHIISNSSYSTWAAYLNQNEEQIVMVPQYKGVQQMCLENWQIVEV